MRHNAREYGHMITDNVIKTPNIDAQRGEWVYHNGYTEVMHYLNTIIDQQFSTVNMDTLTRK